MFLITDFDDGLHLIPECWATPDRSSCLWPYLIKDQFTLNKMVSQQIEPSDDWRIENIKKVYGESDSYVAGIQKLKLCRRTSDIDSGTDHEKKRRRRRFKKSYTSESEDDQEQSQSLISNYPVVPKKMKLKEQDKNDTCSLRFSSLEQNSVDGDKSPTVSKSPCKDSAPGSEISVLNEILSNCPSPVAPMAYVTSTSMAPHFNTCCCAKLESNAKMLEKLLRKTNLIVHKVNILEDKVANIKEIDGDDDSHKTANINQNFPFADVGKFKEFDQALIMDDQLYKNLVKSLKFIGGHSVHHMVANILKRSISNSLAEMYSWAGAKQKLAFKQLKFTKAVLEIALLAFPNTTEDEVGSLIANWLRHAKQRRERAEGVGTKNAPVN